VQTLPSFAGSSEQYAEKIAHPDRNPRPRCQARHRLSAQGFYRRAPVDTRFDRSIRVPRYLCRSSKRTVSLLPELALPYLRFNV
jgi:hypothetical protein